MYQNMYICMYCMYLQSWRWNPGLLDHWAISLLFLRQDLSCTRWPWTWDPSALAFQVTSFTDMYQCTCPYHNFYLIQTYIDKYLVIEHAFTTFDVLLVTFRKQGELNKKYIKSCNLAKDWLSQQVYILRRYLSKIYFWRKKSFILKLKFKICLESGTEVFVNFWITGSWWLFFVWFKSYRNTEILSHEWSSKPFVPLAPVSLAWWGNNC